MLDQRVIFALENFIAEDYFENPSKSYMLMEKEDTGRTELTVSCLEDSLCICNFDAKPRCEFVKIDKKFSMRKCSDHLIFEKRDANWYLHIFEMKTTIGNKTWESVKGKSRTSYLTALAIAAFLGIEILPRNVRVYTTYEKISPAALDEPTAPAALKVQLGKKLKNYLKEELENNIIRINCSDVIELKHTAIQMTKNELTDTLEGSIAI